MENSSAFTPFPSDAALAIAYVRWQELEDVYEPEMALKHGTLFPCLNKPFYGRRARYGQQKRH
ncbi:MAG: spore coat associated protein CotJA [Clostridia bacterium]|nr:spore coat associated protein CotJA [Clostridia bacterium]